ncbi:hypothetical protein ACIPZ5_17825 [Pseudomonas sp. NPDC089428]|uniref:hypothetical protein n=1 Tax=Pseudomonas sp. NPDC089428 TaxID=3364467 RepID=UPI00380D2278
MSTGEFLPGITLPPAIHGMLRKRLTEIQVSDTVVNCRIAQARAESIIETLEILKAIPNDALERLYVMVEANARTRLDEIADGS